MKTITSSALHAFISNVEKHPDNNALHVDGKYYSYREFANLIGNIQQSIKDRGFQNEKLIGVLTIDDVYTYASMLAIMFSGGAYIPINNKNPQQRNSDIITDTDLKVILASVKHEEIENAEGDFSVIDTSQVSTVENSLQILNFDSNSIAYILFTSGSTGKPKGVPIKHKSLSAFLNVMLDEKSGYDFNEEDRFLQMFELTFDMSISSFLLPFCVGACCYVMPQKGISYMNILKLLKTHKITITQMVPSALLYLERFFNEICFPDVRFSIFAGEGLPVSVLPGWQKVIPNATIVNLYGPTEGTIYCLRYDWSENEPDKNIFNGILSIGRPWDGIDICVIDENQEIQQDSSQKGELCIKGAQVTDGYWNNPEKNKSSFVTVEEAPYTGKYYRTGDRVFTNSLGNLMYSGRIDHQVKIDGHRVELGEIEHHVRIFTGTSLVAAIIKPNKNSTQNILAIYIESQGDTSEEALLKYIKSTLPPYMLPKEINYIDKMPINLSGKIDRNALKKGSSEKLVGKNISDLSG